MRCGAGCGEWSRRPATAQPSDPPRARASTFRALLATCEPRPSSPLCRRNLSARKSNATVGAVARGYAGIQGSRSFSQGESTRPESSSPQNKSGSCRRCLAERTSRCDFCSRKKTFDTERAECKVPCVSNRLTSFDRQEHRKPRGLPSVTHTHSDGGRGLIS